MSRLEYQGFTFIAFDGAIPEYLEVRREGESWLDMRERTQVYRDARLQEFERVIRDLVDNHNFKHKA